MLLHCYYFLPFRAHGAMRVSDTIFRNTYLFIFSFQYITQTDSFVSPAASKRIKLGRNDMLLPAESTMGVGLNSADQLMLTALRRLDDIYTEKIPFYPEIVVKYSVEPMFQILCESHNYSVTTIQVCNLYSFSVLFVPTHR